MLSRFDPSMTPGEAYWAERGIEVGAIMIWHDPLQLPGATAYRGIASTVKRSFPYPGDVPIVRVPHPRGGTVIFRNPDEWQPVHMQLRMFGEKES